MNRIKKHFSRGAGSKLASELIRKATESGISKELLSVESGISKTSFARWTEGRVDPHPQTLAKLQDTVERLVGPITTRAFAGNGFSFGFRVNSDEMSDETPQQLEEVKAWITFLQQARKLPEA